MANDPTTTGTQQSTDGEGPGETPPPPGERWGRVNNLCGAVGTVFAGGFEVFVNDESVLLQVQYSADANITHALDLPDVPLEPAQPPPVQVVAPRSLFADDAQIIEWAERVYHDFLTRWHVVLVTETDAHFRDVAFYAASCMGLISASPEEIVKEHLKASGRQLRYRFNLPVSERGQKSAWTEGELMMHLQAIVNELDIPAAGLTWPLIFEKLREREPQRAPRSSESLRKLAGSYGRTLNDLRRVLREAKARRARGGK